MFGSKSLYRLLGLALVFSLLFLSATGSPGAADRPVPSALRSQIDSAIAKVKPALVRIRVVSTDYSEGREVKMQAVGSGAIITRDGYLITNHHVAGHAARIFCTLWNREEIEAELVGTDPLTDIAILKLKPEHPTEFQPAEFGDSSKIQVGEYVLAMGSPMALSQSVTLGIISNTEMTMPRFWGSSRRFQLDGEDVGSLVRWIGHDAAIYGGNSGGPLVNLRGKIIGINEISYGLGGAIPGNLAKSVADQIMAKGRVQRSWFGLDVQPPLQAWPGQARRVDQRRAGEFPGGQSGLQTRRPAPAPGRHRNRCPLRGANAGPDVAAGQPADRPAGDRGRQARRKGNHPPRGSSRARGGLSPTAGTQSVGVDRARLFEAAGGRNETPGASWRAGHLRSAREAPPAAPNPPCNPGT